MTRRNSVSIGLSLAEDCGGTRAALQSRLHDEGRRLLGFFERGRDACPIKVDSDGRPYFEDKHANFSIAHSGLVAAVAYTAPCSPAGTPLAVGCDVQRVDGGKSRAAIARAFFSPREQDYIRGGAAGNGFGGGVDSFGGGCGNSGAGSLLRFHHLWVLKEAFLKARGLSVCGIRGAPVFVLERRETSAAGSKAAACSSGADARAGSSSGAPARAGNKAAARSSSGTPARAVQKITCVAQGKVKGCAPDKAKGYAQGTAKGYAPFTYFLYESTGAAQDAYCLALALEDTGGFSPRPRFFRLSRAAPLFTLVAKGRG